MNIDNTASPKTLTSRFSKEYIERIHQLRQDYYDGKLANPLECVEIEPYIARSWIRCKSQNLDPDTTLSSLVREHGHCLGEPETSVDHALIHITEPIFRAFDRWTPAQHFYISLDSAVSGSRLLSNSMLEKNMEWNVAGKLTDERIGGNTAISIAKFERHPVCVQGGEHYFHSNDNCFLASAPIFDNNGNMSAILNMGTLGTIWVNNSADDRMQLAYSLIMGVLGSLSAAIESKLHLLQVDQILQETNKLLETTLSLVDSEIIAVDQTGTILTMNTPAASALGVKAGEPVTTILPFLSSNSTLFQRIAAGEKDEFEETLFISGKSKQYQIQLTPFNRGNGAVLTLQKSTKLNRLAANRTGLYASFTFSDIVGESRKIQSVIRKCIQWSHSPENVLLCGESGTGKELFAQSIHNEANPSGPFVALNCAAIPRELIESELFGYEQGSFTGADRSGRPGKIELAHHGTLFLDEIGDMPLELQAVLLRVLENKQVCRIGGLKPRKVDFRLISATNRDLGKMQEEGHFRQDLYYRLSVLRITIPPLRSREHDVLLLSNYFLEQNCKKLKKQVPVISTETEKFLLERQWPGNVRQLENAIIYALYSATGNEILPEHFSEDITSAPVSPSPSTQFLTIADAERNAIIAAIEKTDGNMTQASRLLGIGKTTLYRKIKEYHIEES